jgi:hypothetical protein
MIAAAQRAHAAPPAFVAETSLCVWLLLKGVNVSAWNARVGDNAW